ncbi:N-acetylmuramoyl-L-alanine amidase [Propionispora hippei]|uniref:N-acetylmuramoyl-L-alanine amidase n=1 Tax=Propionispora hippei DSM 15287 TaxID=1123003 RepID=A0A1M6C375_9FIRM|nr:N-acetylmuramoyl-L-alanine amidase [Propionispora hippei]SHI55459.1 N-acetylmuramoyl-L-alanine amidase [Propionispora hippei DSM 15287]
MQRKLLFAFLIMMLLLSHMALAAELNVSQAAPAVAGSPLNGNVIRQAAELLNVRFAVHNDAVTGSSKLRLVIDSSGPVEAKGSLVSSPSPQLIVDVQGATAGKISKSLTLDGAIARQMNVQAINSQTSRIVIALPASLGASDYKVFTLKSDAQANKTHRIVVDINKPVPVPSFSFTPGLKNKVIALDPGHGGTDPGAIGSNTQEKTITLAVAQKAKLLLEKAGAKVLLTRQADKDVFGPNASAVDELGARANVGNNNKADVFISIHINAFTDPSVGGIASYYYPKTDYDMLLADSLQDNLVASISGGFSDRGIHQANFYVLKNTVMPASLVELGFISNPQEEKLMNTPQFQQEAAQGLVSGLERFFAQAAVKGGGQ